MYSKPTRGAATSDDDDEYCSFSEHLLCKGTGTTESAFENACLGDLRHVQHHLLHLGLEARGEHMALAGIPLAFLGLLRAPFADAFRLCVCVCMCVCVCVCV